MSQRGVFRGRFLPIIIAVLVGGSAIYFNNYVLQQEPVKIPATTQHIAYSGPKFNATGRSDVCVTLANDLPESVYSAQHPAFNKSTEGYWSQAAAELRPSCIVQPANSEEVSTAVRVLRTEYDAGKAVKFAVRSGGHSPEAGFASIENGVLIDLGLLNGVKLADGKKTVVVGVGARWGDVSKKLDGEGLAIVGGRNAQVGVGGLILGGGISFFSPRYGMVCDNIDEYEIVLADGTITQVSSTQHEDLWRALKGGTGAFGIVTRMTARTFSATKIWSGYAFWMGWQGPQVLEAFHDFNKPENFDEYAAGPILALSYLQSVGVKAIAISLAYTKPEPWAPVFKAFKSIWRVWSTMKVHSLTDAYEELNGMAPYGQRQFQATTTIKNDLDTFNAFRDIFNKKLKEVTKVKAGVWSLVYQPLSAAVTRKGSPNVLGLESRSANDTLIIVLLAVSWENAKDNELVHRIAREIIAEGEAYAREKGTADRYRYLNYAASGQDVFAGYGEENARFLGEVGGRYDPEGFWQRAKVGGFKLDVD